MRRSFSGLFALLLVVSILLPGVPALAATGSGFTDLPGNHPDRDHILYLVQRGILSGYPDGKFGPGDSITRVAAVKVATQVAGYAPRKSGKALKFKDLGGDHWAAGYVRAGVENGLVSGFDDDTFRPNEGLTRAQLAVLALRATRQATDKVPAVAFTDVKSTDWFATHAALAVAAGMLEAPDGAFRPRDIATRAEAARAFAQAMIFTPSAFAVPMDVFVLPQSGTVEIAAPGAERFQAISGPHPLQAGGRIRTGAASAADVSFPDGSGIRIEENSELIILKSNGTYLIEGATVEELEVELVQGQIFAALTPRLSPEELARGARLLRAVSGPAAEAAALAGVKAYRDTAFRVRSASSHSGSGAPADLSQILIYSNPASLEPGDKEGAELTVVLANAAGEPVTADGPVSLVLNSDVGILSNTAPVIPAGYQAVTISLLPPTEEPEDQKTRVTALVGDISTALTIQTQKTSWWSGLFGQKTRAKVRMPFSVASIRGSLVQARVGAGSNELSVLSGDVLLRSDSGETEALNDNQYSKVTSPFAPPSTPEPMPVEHQRQWQALKPWVDKQTEEMSQKAPKAVRKAVKDENERVKNLMDQLPADTAPPTIEITGPAAGKVGGKKVTVTGYASDDVKLKSVRVAGKRAQVDASGAWSAEIELEPGPNQVEAVAEDASGNFASATVELEYDAEFPSISIDARKAVKAKNTSISGRASAPAGIKSLTANGQPVSVSNNGSFAIDASLQSGANLIVIELTDAADRVAKAEVAIISATVGPKISLSGPDSTGDPNYALSGTVTAAEAEVAEVRVNGKKVPFGQDGSFAAGIRLKAGVNEIAVEATDVAGNSSSVTKTVRLAAEGASLQISSPKEGLETKDGRVEVKGSVNAGSGIEAVAVNGAAAAVDRRGNFSATVTLQPGPNTIEVSATDAAGQAVSASRTVVRTGSPPLLSISQPGDGQHVTKSEIMVSGSAKAASGEIRSVRVNGRQVVLDDTGSFNYTVKLSAGENAISVFASDTAGNTVEQSVTVILDASAAVLSLTSPAQGLETTSSAVTVSGSVERGSNISAVTVNGQAISVGGNGRFSTTVTLKAGENLITVSLPGGGSETRTVILRAAPPQISVSSPSDGSTRTTDSVTVSGSAVSTSGSAISRVTVGKQVAGVDGSGGFSQVVSLRQGSNSITVTALDAAGNSASVSVTVNYEPVKAQTGSRKESKTETGTTDSTTTTGTTPDTTTGTTPNTTTDSTTTTGTTPDTPTGTTPDTTPGKGNGGGDDSKERPVPGKEKEK